ncbi:hypothetical protein Zm00014a_021508 [Zea mays]|uniref:Remorin C-terminal domain-containing protein n=1 Tax=Zea mays TaxID=4577 RepID=A0A3L6G5N0_MAIZE|nr:hypothetical protein Zm00014a_021508 [Zea mays]
MATAVEVPVDAPVRTVKVTNVSLSATVQDIKEFFSFSGDIDHVEMQRIEGEEAKMTVWENMQKAEAEAAIQKLVIKLEKKRPYSLERIFNTLRSSSRKTQVVRSTSTANQNQHISRTIKTAPNLSKNGQMSSLSGCFRQDL